MIADYADLQASIANWADRADLATVIPDFVALAEQDIANDLRARQQITSATVLTTGSEFVDLPADLVEIKSVSAAGVPLTYMPAHLLKEQIYYPGEISHYSTEGNRLMLLTGTAAGLSILITYFARVPKLATVSVNWLLSAYPSVYLYAGLVHAERFVKNDARADYWADKYRIEIERIKSADCRFQASGTPLRIRT